MACNCGFADTDSRYVPPLAIMIRTLSLPSRTLQVFGVACESLTRRQAAAAATEVGAAATVTDSEVGAATAY
jgi:hypothetical protein